MESHIAQQICNTDLTLIWTIIGTGIGAVLAILTMNVAIFSWLRSDLHSLENKLEDKVNSLEKKFEDKINSLEERMFYLSAGKTLSQAILDEKIKKEEGLK